MNAAQPLDLSPAGAVRRIRGELLQAERAVEAHELDAALDAYIPALGLALQLGPAAAEEVLAAILATARRLTLEGDADGLSVLGPALAGLASQMRDAGILSESTVMTAWVSVVEGVAALVGQLGLALALPHQSRDGMLAQARDHAMLLDDATGSIFGLQAWLDGIVSPPSS